MGTGPHPAAPADIRSTVPFHEDLMLEGVARQVATDVNTSFSRERLERVATEHERLRLARELHDGVLQSLTGVTFQLRALAKIVEEYPDPVRNRLRDIEQLLQSEQRNLRAWIETLKPKSPTAMASTSDMSTALGALCDRFSRWGMCVTFAMPTTTATIPRTLGDEIYRLVQEGLSNAARHAKARNAAIELEANGEQIRLVIDDNGIGFPFKGRYDLALLNARDIGPTSIKERVAALNGRMSIFSTLSGSRIEITLPNQPKPIVNVDPRLRA